MLKIFQMVPQAEREHLCQFEFSQFCFCFSWQWNQEELWLYVVCLFFNFTQQRIKVQIWVFILHIPLSTALCQGSVSRAVVNCDAVLFIIALLNRKIGETWKYISSAQCSYGCEWYMYISSLAFLQFLWRYCCLSDHYIDNLHTVSLVFCWLVMPQY